MAVNSLLSMEPRLAHIERSLYNDHREVGWAADVGRQALPGGAHETYSWRASEGSSAPSVALGDNIPAKQPAGSITGARSRPPPSPPMSAFSALRTTSHAASAPPSTAELASYATDHERPSKQQRIAGSTEVSNGDAASAQVDWQQDCCAAYFASVSAIDKPLKSTVAHLSSLSPVLAAAVVAVGARLLQVPDILRRAEETAERAVATVEQKPVQQVSLWDFRGILLLIIYFGDENGWRLSRLWPTAVANELLYAFVDHPQAYKLTQNERLEKQRLLILFWKYFELSTSFLGQPTISYVSGTTMTENLETYLNNPERKRAPTNDGSLRVYFNSVTIAAQACSELDRSKYASPLAISHIEKVADKALRQLETLWSKWSDWLVSASQTPTDSTQVSVPFHNCAFTILCFAIGPAPTREWLLSSSFMINCVRDLLQHGMDIMLTAVRTRHWHLHSVFARYTFASTMKTQSKRMVDLALLVPEHVDVRQLSIVMQRLLLVYDRFVIPSPFATREAKEARALVEKQAARLEREFGISDKFDATEWNETVWTEEDDKATHEIMRFDCTFWNDILGEEVYV